MDNIEEKFGNWFWWGDNEPLIVADIDVLSKDWIINSKKDESSLDDSIGSDTKVETSDEQAVESENDSEQNEENNGQKTDGLEMVNQKLYKI